MQQRTGQILSIQNLYSRNSGVSINGNAVKRLMLEQLEQRFTDPDLVLAMDSNQLVMLALDEQIKRLEKRVLAHARLDPRYQYLLTINGIGKILTLTIMLETGDITRFEYVGNFASYCG
ncbi:MAG: IS110 family transposase [Aestuariibacter sp.]|nr:IS110 family transposase [Aestuariibacter sp.]